MITKDKIFLFIIIAAYFSSVATASASNPTGKLSNAQVAALKDLGIKIAIPTYIPEGFEVSNIQMEPCPPNATGVLRRNAKGVCRFKPEYSVIYKNSNRNCFSLNAVGGGIGDVGNEYEYKINTKLLGEVRIVFGKQGGEITDGKFMQKPSPQQLRTPQQKLGSLWAGGSPFYRIDVADEGICDANTSISPLELEKMLKSMTWLK